MSNLLDVGTEYINVDGQLVERDALLVAEAINDYDPTLRVICVDPVGSNFNDAPFIIAQVCPDGVMRRIFEAWELNNSVLQRIEAADTTRHDVQAKIDWINAEATKASKSRYKEKRVLIQDMGVSLLKHRKSSFTYKDPDTGEFVTIYDDKRPVERK